MRSPFTLFVQLTAILLLCNRNPRGAKGCLLGVKNDSGIPKSFLFFLLLSLLL